MRLLIVQHAGDYREAYERLSAGGAETYYAQKYSVEIVARLGPKLGEVATLCCLTDEKYDRVLAPGVRAIGIGAGRTLDLPAIIAAVAEYRPTHLVARSPLRQVFQWAGKAGIPSVGVFADSFLARGLRARWQHYRLAHALNQPSVQWVFDHGVAASLSLAEIGVNREKIVPWDYPPEAAPAIQAPKTSIADPSQPTAVYASSFSEAKGLGDTLEAVALLHERGIPLQLNLAGGGDRRTWLARAETLGIREAIHFLGLVPNAEIVPLMRRSDLVLLPSRHEYPEGFPCTILEAFSARTPLVASDHPMFRYGLTHDRNAVLFRASNPRALADAIADLLADPQRYRRLSEASLENHARDPGIATLADAFERWLGDDRDRAWLAQRCLASGRYPRLESEF